MLAAWGKIARRALDGIGCSDGKLADRIAAEFHARRAAADRLFADARPCLDALSARGHVLGLVTNGDRRMQRDKLARHQLAAYFGAVAYSRARWASASPRRRSSGARWTAVRHRPRRRRHDR